MIRGLRTTAAALAIAGAGIGAGLALPGNAAPTATCERAPAVPEVAPMLRVHPGRRVWRCVIPTQGRSAVVYLRAFEDGSGLGAYIDPDGKE